MLTDNKVNDMFPENTFSKFVTNWYSAQLIALEESSIYSQRIDINKQCYRFTCLRTFHNPFSIRIDINSDNSVLLTFKMSSGAGGYDPGTLIKDMKIELTKLEVNKLLMKIDDIKYWNMQSLETKRGLDGSEWLIEGLLNGNYYIVQRWSPKTTIKDLGSIFIELSKETITNLY